VKVLKFNIKYLLAFIAFVAIEVFIALFIRDNFIRPYLGDVLVVIVVYCLLRSFLRANKLLPLWIFLFAAAVEVAQFFNIIKLLNISSRSFLGILIGSTFSIEDLICYFAGCLGLVLWQVGCEKFAKREVIE
jgi:Protein of unknown function (DUF2809).